MKTLKNKIYNFVNYNYEYQFKFLFMRKLQMKLNHLLCNIKILYCIDDDYYMFVAYDKNNKIIDYSLFDCDYEFIDIIEFANRYCDCDTIENLINECFE